MLTLADITNEVKRLLGKQMIGIAQVGPLIYISDGSGKTVTIKVTDADLALSMPEFSRLKLDKLEGLNATIM